MLVIVSRVSGVPKKRLLIIVFGVFGGYKKGDKTKWSLNA